MKRTLALLAFAFFTLSGCVTVSHSVLVEGLPPVSPQDVTIYFAGEEVPEHTRVAILAARGDDMFTTEGGMLNELREQAGELGANAIVLDEVAEPSGGAKIAGALTGFGAERRGRAIAILIEAQP